MTIWADGEQHAVIEHKSDDREGALMKVMQYVEQSFPGSEVELTGDPEGGAK